MHFNQPASAGFFMGVCMAEPVSTAAALGAAILKSALSCLPGAAGAAVSLKFLGDGLSFSQKLISFSVGFACAVYIAPALIELFNIGGERVHSGLEFGVLRPNPRKFQTYENQQLASGVT
ncbi:hypothetical protein AAKU55_005912 [Oxalobacteraceae bacterium GrIS 1.11]